jgi:SAM-dependent methyltransferase
MKDFTNISKQTIERYSSRYKDFGRDIKTLGWGSTAQQNYRFQNVFQYCDFKEKSILDIGCGFGDLNRFLIDNKIEFESYTGWDINKDLLNEVEDIHSSNINYQQIDIATYNLDIFNDKFNIGIMLGLLNFNLKSDDINYEYSKTLIKNAFNVVNEVLVVDFLSTCYTNEYPIEDFVFYHNPSVMLEFALSMTSNIVLKHNYSPIPQKEFMLFLYK